ncbi:hypothetical protein [Winogradskyella haliclonae]|uniref:Oxygen tolerance n=1 Tax=Winogradskyella haliclonae TaxID=2048558 RepID=A0ABQ2BX39_9FLAO|nr:hypothetical protein [Winogradskyella haliclonae]GGI56073.1 hypothetical protein GCM10011444_03820 [Winogradskyella haliclonae]
MKVKRIKCKVKSLWFGALVSAKPKLLSIAFLLYSFFSFSQVTTEVDTTNIRIGEQISYKIKVETDSTKLVVFPEGQTFMPLEVVEALKIDTTKKASKFQLLREYKLTQFDSGSYYIPRQKIIVGDTPFFTDSLKVDVNTIEIDTTKQGLYDIKPIIEVDKSASKWWLYLLIVLAAIALIGFLLYWFIWRKKPLTEEEEIALLPPYDRAKLAISKLENQNYLERSDLKGFYSELTFIIRKFLDEKVYDRSLESTTDQLIERLQLLKDGNQFNFQKDTISNIDTIFKRADLVKFAKSQPDIALAELDKQTISNELDAVKAILPEPSEEEKLLNLQYKEAQERKEKRKKILLTTAISLFILIATFVGFGTTYGFGYVKDKILGHNSIELLEGNWVKSAYGFPPIYIETPKVLKRVEVELPEEAEGKVKTLIFNYTGENDEFNIATQTTIIGKQKEEDADVQKAINLNNIIEQNLKKWEDSGVRNIITKNEEFLTPNEAQGIKTFGTAEFPTSEEDEFYEAEYMLLSFTTEQVVQQITIVWRVNDSYADDIVKRVVDSIELNPNVNREEETK